MSAGHRPTDPAETSDATIVQAYLQASAQVKADVARLCTADIVRAADVIAEAIAAGGKLLLCGNGGSAADCQHMAAELVSRLTADFERPGIPAIALTTDTSFLTAYANDLGFDGVFARQLDALGRSGDVVLGISTSGRSTNVVRAFERAKASGVRRVALLGEGGPLADLADVAVRVPSRSTQHVQEAHLAIEHLICSLVERRLYAGPSPR